MSAAATVFFLAAVSLLNCNAAHAQGTTGYVVSNDTSSFDGSSLVELEFDSSVEHRSQTDGGAVEDEGGQVHYYNAPSKFSLRVKVNGFGKWHFTFFPLFSTP